MGATTGERVPCDGRQVCTELEKTKKITDLLLKRCDRLQKPAGNKSQCNYLCHNEIISLCTTKNIGELTLG